MNIVISETEAGELSKDTQTLINLILECQNQLTRQDILAYFKANPEEASSLLIQAQDEVRSFPIIIRGLKEKLNSEVLPPIGEEIDHPSGWLEVGDIFVGVTGFCHSYPYDRPYTVTKKTENDEYEWRYIDEPGETSRPPMRLDPGLRLYAWWKVPLDKALIEDEEDLETVGEDIKAFLDKEIASLNEYASYLKDFTR